MQSNSWKIHLIDHKQLNALCFFTSYLIFFKKKISPIRHSCLAIYPNNEVLRDCKAICVDNILQYLLPLFILCLYIFILYIFLFVQNHFTLLCKILFLKRRKIYSNHLAFCSSSYDDACLECLWKNTKKKYGT